MSRSTFSGPILVGVDDSSFVESLNPIVIKTGPNWGFLKMAQSAPITQNGEICFPTTTTKIGMVIPARSTITRISFLITVAWTNSLRIGQAWGTGPDGIPNNYDHDELADDIPLNTAGLGLYVVNVGDTDNLAGNEINNWMNNSDNVTDTALGVDRCITTKTPAGGTLGVGILTVEYCQAVNLEPIA